MRGSWPGAYAWRDHGPNHNYRGYGPGGVLVSGALRKAEPEHPHAAGPPQEQPRNDQAAGRGVATYRQFAVPYGSIDESARTAGGTNLKHYDYRGKNAAVDQLVVHHGYRHYYAGGRHGKPDLLNRHYGSGHLMVYDPEPQSGGDFGERDYTDAWRKTHELAHALTHKEVNGLYGEGRRIGKLGVHRTPREAKRAVHWEWLAAHKQRELNRSIGIDVPDDVFNRELNTVMHDAVHRAVTGQFTEPSQEGFVPHPHAVPLQTALGMVDEHARRLGLGGEHDLVKKSEITLGEALARIHAALRQIR